MSRELRIRQKYLREQNREYGPVMVELPRERWINSYYRDVIPARVFRSSRFLAQVFEERDGAIRISVNRTEIDDRGNWRQGVTWDELQRVKDECGFGDCWAVEIFPANRHVVNIANLRHLFVLPCAPAYGWRGPEARA